MGIIKVQAHTNLLFASEASYGKKKSLNANFRVGCCVNQPTVLSTQCKA